MGTDLQISEFNRALLSLEGLLWGIAADDIVNKKELEKLKNWKKKHYESIQHHPVGDLIQMLDSAVECRILQEEEKAFIKGFCREYGQCEESSDPFLCDTIRMNGYIEGILADKKIYEKEIRSFYLWLINRPHLNKLKEYETILAKSNAFLKGRQISNEEMFHFLTELSESLKETGTPPL